MHPCIAWKQKLVVCYIQEIPSYFQPLVPFYLVIQCWWSISRAENISAFQMCSSSHCSWVMTLSHILSVYPSEIFMVYQDLPTRTTGYKPYAGYILLIALFVNHNLDPIFRNIHGHPAGKIHVSKEFMASEVSPGRRVSAAAPAISGSRQ